MIVMWVVNGVGVVLGSLWGRFGVDLGSIWGRWSMVDVSPNGIDKKHRTGQFSAPDCFSGLSFGRFIEIPIIYACAFSLPHNAHEARDN